MGNVLRDVQFALRLLRKHPGFTLTVVMILGVGIGMNTVIFSAVNTVLLRALPYPQSGRLVQLFFSVPQDNFLVRFLNTTKLNFSFPDFEDIRTQQQIFEELALYQAVESNFKSDQGAERLTAAMVSERFFPLLRINPLLGRNLLPEDFNPSNTGVMMLSHSLWQKHFAGNPAIVGKSVSWEGRSFTVVGIMPADFVSIPSKNWAVRSELQRSQIVPQLWIPFWPSPGDKDRGSMQFDLFARLKPGIAVERAQADLNLIASRIEQQYPHPYFKGWGVAVEPLRESLLGRYRTLLLILQGAVGLVLLIACTNIANLLLARAMARQGELAIRASLGAGRKRVLCQLVTESIVLSLLGGGLALFLAQGGLRLLNSLLPHIVIGLPSIQLDAQVLGFTCLLSLLTGAGFGLAPALLASRINLNEALHQNRLGCHRRNRLSRLLVVAQVSLTLALLIASGLLVKTFLRLWNVHPGCQTSNILTMRLDYTGGETQDRRLLLAYYRRVLEKVTMLPGVESAGYAIALPTSGSYNNTTVAVEGIPEAQKNPIHVHYQPSSPQYFRTMGIPLRQGRFFMEQDNENAPLVALISETMARVFWPGQNPVGRQVTLENQPRRIVGVVGDVRQEDLATNFRCSMYLPYSQYTTPTLTLAVRTLAKPQELSAAIRDAIYSVDANHPVSQVRTMEMVVAEGLLSLRLIMFLLMTMAGCGLILALLGVYGVLASVVAQRRREIGVRMALGAQRQDVVIMVLRQGLTLVLLGIGFGVFIAWGVTWILTSQLYGVTPTDPATFVGVSLMLITAAALACAIPAHRAAQVDPIVTLKYE